LFPLLPYYDATFTTFTNTYYSPVGFCRLVTLLPCPSAWLLVGLRSISPYLRFPIPFTLVQFLWLYATLPFLRYTRPSPFGRLLTFTLRWHATLVALGYIACCRTFRIYVFTGSCVRTYAGLFACSIPRYAYLWLVAHYIPQLHTHSCLRTGSYSSPVL